MFLILKKNQLSAFTILRTSYETCLKKSEASALVIAQILKHVTNKRKMILFRQLENISESAGYWQAKGTVLFIEVIQKKVQYSLSISF